MRAYIVEEKKELRVIRLLEEILNVEFEESYDEETNTVEFRVSGLTEAQDAAIVKFLDG